MSQALRRLEPRREQTTAFAVLRFDFGKDVQGGHVFTNSCLVIGRFLHRQHSSAYSKWTHQEDRQVTRYLDHAGAVLVNPENVLSMLTHWARGRPGTIHMQLPASILRINHYVDIFRDRCEAEAKHGDPPCNMPDDSILWVKDALMPFADSLCSRSQSAHESQSRHRPHNTKPGMDTFEHKAPMASMLSSSPPRTNCDNQPDERHVLVIVPGHGESTRTSVLLANLQLLRNQLADGVTCLLFVHKGGTEFPQDPDNVLQYCEVVRKPGVFMEFLLDPTVELSLSQADYVLLMLDDISLISEKPTMLSELVDIMKRNCLDVTSAALVGTHLSYEGMRPGLPRRLGQVGRRTNFIEWQMPLFTKTAFRVLRNMVRPWLSSTWGYDELFQPAFKHELGRDPAMGVVDTMHITHTGAWLASTLNEDVVYKQEEALLAYYAKSFNITPVVIRMHLGKLL
eukprot:gnl/MRDRNA2_/MRDRNA2_328429_c0_seq1.p1 gnl/MRDRNA2_/MRDRNA2_328429_c0~~gnl/MRDRNA2_/MRDRNA2_328429_c0_seq1.p1  ORF type:complete len:523 (+),score=53.86 gnl/MRDRNA2_/MRDRNA2_328429_c0_seq1:208-1569(+)